MKVGIIGIGSTTLDFGTRAVKAGYEVLINSPRGQAPCNEMAKNMGKNAKLSCIENTAKAEIIILFVPWDDLQKTIELLPDMTEKIILHTNNYLFSPECSVTDEAKKTATQTIASLLPTAYVVKVFSTINTSDTSNRTDENKRILFSTENKKVKNSVKTFLDKLEFCSTELNDIYRYNNFNSLGLQ